MRQWRPLTECLICLVLGIILGCLWGYGFAYVYSDPNHDTPQEPLIRKVIADQQDAWNRGDLDGFMAGYWNSPGLTFRSGGTVTQGYADTLARYRKKYKAPGAEMGRLTFDDIAVTLLRYDAVVTGRWTLDRTDDTPTGLFTLRLRLTDVGWKIVDDHTSAVEPTPLKKK